MDVDADIFLSNDIIKNLNGEGFLQATPKINEKIDNSELPLEYLAKKFEAEFNKKVNFSDIDKDNYTNMIYILFGNLLQEPNILSINCYCSLELVLLYYP